MAKKRQQDFVKTQLKPGRSLKRRSSAAPNVKAKKITVRKKSVDSRKSIPTILDSLNSAKTGSVPYRLTLLQQLENLITAENVTVYIAEIFESVAKLTLDTNLRGGAVTVLKKIFEMKHSETLKTKILSVSPLLINVLKSGMASTTTKVKGSTLVLLVSILEHHPDLICNSLDILKSFHHLICVPLRKLAHQQSKSSNSLMPILLEGQINNENYKKQVFEALKLFLKEMLKNFETDEEDDNSDEQDIYLNLEGQCDLPIYAGGGLKPVDIEKSDIDPLNAQMLDYENSDFSVYDSLIPIIRAIRHTFLEEIPSHMNANDNLQQTVIQNVSVLLQVLCQIAELIDLMPCDEVDSLIRNFLLDDIYKHGLFPFHPSNTYDSKQCCEAIELNLAVCFLHSKFIFQDDKGHHIEDTISYIRNAIGYKKLYEIKDSIPMLVKILKTYYSMTHLLNQHFIVDTLDLMSKLLKPDDKKQLSHVQHLNKNELVSLFIYLSLNPTYDFVMKSLAMRNWFNWLLTQLTNIRRGTCSLNRNLLRVIKRIAAHKYPFFMQELDKIDDKIFKDLLSHDNPDVRDTVMFLIYNKENISGNLLEDISNIVMLDSSFLIEDTIRLIRLLTSRFIKYDGKSSDISDFRKGQRDVIQFILNIAVDSLNIITDKWFDPEANEYVKAFEEVKNVMPYNIIPNIQWKEHSKLFNICQKSLNQMPRKLVDGIFKLMLGEILNAPNLPMHSTIAILKLYNWETKNRGSDFQMMMLDDFILSALLTMSVLTNIRTEDEWYKYNVVELMDNIKLNRRLALETVPLQLDNINELNGIAAYHILRICKFFLKKDLFVQEDSERVLTILENLKDKCSDTTFSRQPLFRDLFHAFYFY